MPTRVIGVEYDGSSANLTFGVHLVPILKADYGDSLEPDPVIQTGSQAIAAYTPGSYKVKQAKITFRSSVFRTDILPRMPGSGFGNVRISLVVNFIHPEIGADSDLLQDARIMDIGAAIEASNKGLEVETTWQPIQILWGSARKRINFPPGGVPPTITGGLAFNF